MGTGLLVTDVMYRVNIVTDALVAQLISKENGEIQYPVAKITAGQLQDMLKYCGSSR